MDFDFLNINNLRANPPADTNPPAFNTPPAAAVIADPIPPESISAEAAAPTEGRADPAASGSPEGTPTVLPEDKEPTSEAGEGAAAGTPEKTPASPAGAPVAGTPPADAVLSGTVDPVLGNETAEQYKARLQSEMEATVIENANKRFLETLGVESIDELKARLNPAKELTEEQKKRQADIHKAAVQEYSVRELGMSPDDFSRIDRYNSLNDRDLVFDRFQQEWMQNNKDNPQFADKDLAQEALYEFETLFHLNSENARVKGLGEQSLKLSADQIRNETNGIYQNAETGYNNFLQAKSDVTQFKQAIQKSIGSDLPGEMEFNLPNGGKAKYLLDKIDKKALEGYLRSNANFDQFLKGQKKDFPSFLKQKIGEYIAINHYNEMVATVSQTAHDAGLKKATVGAKSPFTTAAEKPVNVDQTELSDQDRQKIASLTARG